MTADETAELLGLLAEAAQALEAAHWDLLGAPPGDVRGEVAALVRALGTVEVALGPDRSGRLVELFGRYRHTPEVTRIVEALPDLEGACCVVAFWLMDCWSRVAPASQ